MSARSCDQLCPITGNREMPVIGISLLSSSRAVPPVSVHQCLISVLIIASCQCPSVPHISAYQCTSMPHSAHLSCLSVSPISASQCHLSMPISATYQYCQSVPPIGASQ
ncbi:unnamed protein product, partial [Staurois parvus]